MRLIKYLTNKINACIRYVYNKQNQKRLQHKTFSVIASNCNGAFILHDLGLRFNSPFVNLYLTPKDFIRYLNHIAFYQQQTLTFPPTDKPYPVGKLADISIHFMHYHSEQDAEKKWKARTQRMNLADIFIIMTDRDGCDYQDLVEFDQLPFKQKVVFTHKPYPELKSAFYIKGFEQNGMVGDLFEYTGLNGKRYYDQFDYVAWFNKRSDF